MPTLYLTQTYAVVHRDGQDALLVDIPEKKRGKDGTPAIAARKEHVPLIKIDEVVVLGEITMTTSALHLLLERNIEITFLGHFGQFKGRLSPPFSKNAALRQAQYRAHEDMTTRCDLARRFVIGKLSNQRQRLQRAYRTGQQSEMGRSIQQLSDCIADLTALSVQQPFKTRPIASGDQRIEGTPLQTILGIEGAGSAAYFRSFGMLLTDQKQWPFAGRVKRPPTDPVNALLSFGYSILTSKVASAIQTVGFDHFVGYLHSSFYGRPSLALDLVEEFRPVIVDSVVINMLNNHMLSTSDFLVEVGAYRLKPEKRKVFFTKFEERLDEEIQHPIFGYKTSYRRCLELQTRLLAKALTGEIESYPPLQVK